MDKITEKQKTVYEVDEDHVFDTKEQALEYILEGQLSALFLNRDCRYEKDIAQVDFIVKELVFARNFEGYHAIKHPDLPMTLEYLKERLTFREFEFLMEHALCLACLQGNSFPLCIEQYCLDAYVNLWQNSAVGKDCKIPNLYPVTAAEYYFGDKK